MLIPPEKTLLEFTTPVKGVIHIGGNKGEELPVYFGKFDAKKVVIFEPIPASFGQIPVMENVIKVNKALGNRDGATNFNLANNGESSSILKPKTHLTEHPWVTFNSTISVQIARLNTWFAESGLEKSDYNFLAMDVQGYELEVLKGATDILPSIEVLTCEVNCKELYENCAMVEQIDEFLKPYGFTRVETVWYGECGWGDALYSKKR